jgi:hypothetical protein
MIRHKKHVVVICLGMAAAIAGATLYGVGIVGLGIVLLFGGIVIAGLTNAERICRNNTR